MRKVQQGFTLIELIMVIVIIGILASVAMPRFFDLQSDARKAKLDAITGALRSASAIAHSGALVKNVAASASNTTAVVLEGAAMDMIYGFPAAKTAAGGILTAANIDPNDSTLDISVAGGVMTIKVKDATTPAKCQVTYTQATSASSGAPIEQPKKADGTSDVNCS